MVGGLESRCVGRVYGADCAVHEDAAGWQHRRCIVPQAVNTV